jgi:hypothetical protein
MHNYRGEIVFKYKTAGLDLFQIFILLGRGKQVLRISQTPELSNKIALT